MLENAIQQKIALGKSFLIGDSTYKLIEKEKLLLSFVITLDIHRKIRPVCIILSQHENTEA